MLKKVLVVEDVVNLHKAWHLLLEDRVQIISALTVEEAEEKFAANPDIVAIAMDACVPGNSINTIPLVQKIRATFLGPIIAISSSLEYQEVLIKAGCSHQSTKAGMPEKLIGILGI